MNLLVINLSDLHITAPLAPEFSKDRVRLLAQSATRNGPYAGILLILCGDIAYGGQIAEYQLAQDFISELTARLNELTGHTIKVCVAPGNHDCDFSSPSKLRSFARTQRNEETVRDEEMFSKLAAPMANFRSFEGKVETLSYSERSHTVKSASFEIEDCKFQIRVWASSLYSEMKERKGELYLPPGDFEAGWEQDAFRISVMHHPPAWIADPESRSIRTALRTHAHLALYGHEHEPEVVQVTSYDEGATNEAIEVDGPVLHAHGGSSESNFLTFEIELPSGALRTHLHSWSASHFIASDLANLGRSSGWMSLPRKAQAFEISQLFLDKLEDPGLSVTSHSGKRILARDLYVPCDLSQSNSSSSVDSIISASALTSAKECEGGVVIQGDERAGKTTLLLQLFHSYYDAGFIPIYVCLREHKIKQPKDLQKIIANSFSNIYPKETADSHAAVERRRRIFLIDDVDVLSKPVLRTALVDYLNSKCDYFVVTTSLKLQLTEVLTNDSEHALGTIKNKRFQKFSYLKRGQLIQRWLKKVEELDDEEEFLKRLDYIEKGASVALGQNLVPRVPQMLLIFLHSTSASSPAKLESGALANYYSYLVTDQLMKAGVQPDSVEEYTSFARIVSFFMHTEQKQYVTMEDLEVCNTKFAERFHPGSMRERLNVLRNAGLLVDLGDSFKWRHSYLHYLFLGGFLGMNGDEPEVEDAIKKMCSNLYVRTNANALLFLVHFNKDRKIFGYLRQVIDGLFKDATPLKLGKDTKVFASIIENVESLIVPSDVLAERDNHRKAKDTVTDSSNDSEDNQPTPPRTKSLEDITVLFKTSEILGQVLKEQYASIPRKLREPIVVALLSAYMRAAGAILGDLATNQTSLQAWITKSLAQEDETLTEQKRTEFAQALVAELVQMIMFAFFQKLGENLSSEKTLDLIKHVSWERTLEVDMFLLGCELNLQKPIPLGRIDQLLELAKDDPAFVALIRNLVQVRVSLFHTRAPELQALASRFKVDVSGLNAIDFRGSRER